MSDENLISAQEMIMTAFTNIERAQIEQNNALLKSWKFTVQSIKSNAKNGENLGMNLYSHSRVVDLKNEILLVECDHPGWIQTLRLYQTYILTGLKRGVPEAKISSLAFKLRGTNAELHPQISDEKLKQELQEKLDKEEKVLNEFDKTAAPTAKASSPKPEMPENLRAILDKLKNDMMEAE